MTDRRGVVSHFLTDGCLKINGKVIVERQGLFDALHFEADYDSTHFSNGQRVNITVSVTDNLGRTFPNTYSPTIYNVATLDGRGEWENDIASLGSAGTLPARSNLAGMNFDVSRTNVTATWTMTDILRDIQPCTTCYVNTHGLSSVVNPNAPTAFLNNYGASIYPLSDGAEKLRGNLARMTFTKTTKKLRVAA